MSEDRDRRRPRTPPAGVRSQTAAPIDDHDHGDRASWDDDVTPLPADPRLAMARVDRRVKITGQAALDRFDNMRSQVASDVRDIDIRIDALSSRLAQVAESAAAVVVGKVRDIDIRIDALSSRLAQVAESTAAVVGKLDVIMADRAVDRQETSDVRFETARTELEIRKSQALAMVGEQRARSAHRRRLVMRVLAAVGAVWATVSTLILARGC